MHRTWMLRILNARSSQSRWARRSTLAAIASALIAAALAGAPAPALAEEGAEGAADPVRSDAVVAVEAPEGTAQAAAAGEGASATGGAQSQRDVASGEDGTRQKGRPVSDQAQPSQQESEEGAKGATGGPAELPAGSATGSAGGGAAEGEGAEAGTGSSAAAEAQADTGGAEVVGQEGPAGQTDDAAGSGGADDGSRLGASTEVPTGDASAAGETGSPSSAAQAAGTAGAASSSQANNPLGLDINFDYDMDGDTDDDDFAAYLADVRAAGYNDPSSSTRSQAHGLSVTDRLYGLNMGEAPSIEGAPTAEQLASMPTYYLNNIGQATSVKDQNPWGDCWAFAAASALESSILKARAGAVGTAYDASLHQTPKLTGIDDQGVDVSELMLAWLAHGTQTSGSQAGEGLTYQDTSTNTSAWEGRLGGGFATAVARILEAWQGAVSENQVPYHNQAIAQAQRDKGTDAISAATYASKLSEPDTSANLAQLAHVNGVYYLPSPNTTIDVDGKVMWYAHNAAADVLIKQALVKYGAVAIRYKADQAVAGQAQDTTYMNTDAWVQYDDTSTPNIDHVVTIVGWNDNIDTSQYGTTGNKGTVASVPKGAWLIKNSWGSTEYFASNVNENWWGNYGITDSNGFHTGYFWLSYYDHTIECPLFFSVDDVTDGLDYDHNYSYDLSLTQNECPVALSTSDANTKVANVFAAGRDERLEAVSAQTTLPNSQVHVDVYLLDKAGLADSDPTNDSAPVSSADYAAGLAGFHTLVLDKVVDLAKGQLFAIVERITSQRADGTTYAWLNLEGDTAPAAQALSTDYGYTNKFLSTVVANEGETYAYLRTASGYRWLTPQQITDGFGGGTALKFGNAYIKAFTVDDVRTTTNTPTWEPLASGMVAADATATVLDSQLATDGSTTYSLVATGESQYSSSKTYTLYQQGDSSWTKLGTLCEGVERAAIRMVGKTLYGAYLIDDSSVGWKSTLRLARWDSSSSVWQTIATQQAATYTSYEDMSLGESGGLPLVVLRKYTSASEMRNALEALRLDGTSLTKLGSDFVPTGFSNSTSGGSDFRTVQALATSDAPAVIVSYSTHDYATDKTVYSANICSYVDGSWTSVVLPVGDLSTSCLATAVDGTTYLLAMQDSGAPRLLVLKDGVLQQELATTGLPQVRIESMALVASDGRLYCVAYEGNSELNPTSVVPRAYVASLSSPAAFARLGLDDAAVTGTKASYGIVPSYTAQAALVGNRLVATFGNAARSLEAFPKVVTAAVAPDPIDLAGVPARRTDGTSATARAAGESNLVLLVRFAGDTTGNWDEASQAYTGMNAPYLADARPEIRSKWEHLERLYNCVGDGYVKGTVREYLYLASQGKHDLISYFPQTTVGGQVAYITLDKSVSYYRAQSSDYELVRDVLAKFAALFPNYRGWGLDTNGDGLVDNLTLLLTTPSWSWVSQKFDVGGMGLTLVDKGVFNVNLIDLSEASDNLDAVAEHEYLHTLGQPDLYVRKGDAKPVGIWDILSSTAGEPWPLAQTRADLEWTTLAPIDWQTVSADGTYTLRAGTDGQAPEAYILRSPLKVDEYFVVECRRQGGKYTGDLDRNLAGTDSRSTAGVIVYRVNKAHESNIQGMGTCRVYVFRPGDTTTSFAGGDGKATDAAGIVSNAMLTSGSSWASVGSTSRTASLADGGLVFSDGTSSGIRVTETAEDGASATIKVEFADFSDLVTSIAGATVSVAGATYMGAPLTPAVTVILGGRTLRKDVDYTLSYANNVDAGTDAGVVTVTGIGAYVGTREAKFTIKAASIAGASVRAASVTYTGAEQRPAVTVEVAGTTLRTLKEGRDYTLAYTDNTNAGTATVIVTGTGNYTGTVRGTFAIEPASLEGKATVSGSAVTYGMAQSPTVTVKLGDLTLKEGTDYRVTSYGSGSAGTSQLTVSGIGNYKGYAWGTYQVNHAQLSEATVSASNVTYNGSAQTPDVTVTWRGRSLAANTDYELVSCANNTNVGTATFTLRGLERGNFEGQVEGRFSVLQASLDGATVSVPDVTYTGSALEPEVTVVVGNRTLAAGTDYTVAYANNVGVGTGTVTVTGTGNYTGVAWGSFQIAQPAPAPVPVVEACNMYRCYNPNSGEHFYTASAGERDHIVSLGWKDEGVGWTAPKTSNSPVYRLYNPNAGDHHYTLSAPERDMLVSVGWNYEGIGWYSDDAQSVPLYRQYNPNAVAGAHNFTTSKAESDMLVGVGWSYEGISWYGVDPSSQSVSVQSRDLVADGAEGVETAGTVAQAADEGATAKLASPAGTSAQLASGTGASAKASSAAEAAVAQPAGEGIVSSGEASAVSTGAQEDATPTATLRAGIAAGEERARSGGSLFALTDKEREAGSADR